MPDWQQEFKHGLVGEGVPEHRVASSSSHELPLEPRAKVVPSKHNIFITSRETGIAMSVGGSSVRIMGFHTTGPAVKKHISSEMARELIAIIQRCTICL